YHYLAQIAEILTMVRSQIVVAGFSNLQGTHQDGPSGASPWEVSAMRAVQVTSYFTEKKGLAPYQFLVQGHGSARPLVPDTSKESHARNERVEITITNQPV
ncbi:MAG: OmpA/MotB family protein, partial [Desulfovibrionales bacterium]